MEYKTCLPDIRLQLMIIFTTDYSTYHPFKRPQTVQKTFRYDRVWKNIHKYSFGGFTKTLLYSWSCGGSSNQSNNLTVLA